MRIKNENVATEM